MVANKAVRRMQLLWEMDDFQPVQRKSSTCLYVLSFKIAGTKISSEGAHKREPAVAVVRLQSQ